MGYKLKTSMETERLINQMEASENLPWFTLARLAVALSLRQGPLQEADLLTDSLGKELNRYSLVGEDDCLFKCLVEMQEGRHLTDDEYFPTRMKAHLDRGAPLLAREQQYSNHFLVHLTELEKAI